MLGLEKGNQRASCCISSKCRVNAYVRRALRIAKETNVEGGQGGLEEKVSKDLEIMISRKLCLFHSYHFCCSIQDFTTARQNFSEKLRQKKQYAEIQAQHAK